LWKAGYVYVNLDDGMVAQNRVNGKLQPDPKFPSGNSFSREMINDKVLSTFRITFTPTECILVFTLIGEQKRVVEGLLLKVTRW
jgi:hypothetical protein